MAKFYVESGDLRQIVEAVSPICAASRALTMIDPEESIELRMAKIVTVNERGFIRDRPYRRHQPGDMVLETGTLLTLISEHEL